MNRSTINLNVFLALGLGLVLALLWLFSGGRAGDGIPNVHAADLARSTQARPQTPDSLYASAPITRYVAVTGTDAGACATPGGACQTIQYAVDVAVAGDVIKVAAGDYTGVQSHAAPPGYDGPATVSQIVYLDKGLTIRGGYTTTNDFADPPDSEVNPTTLDAQGQGRVLLVSGSIHPTVEGLRITGGNSTNQGGVVHPNFTQAGGGICVIDATATISDNQIFGNTAGTAGAGGGVFLLRSEATLRNNTITANTAQGWYGGGMFLYFSPITFNNNTVSANTARWGGAVFLENSAATLFDNTFSANVALEAGGALNVHNSAATINENLVSNNTANYGGGMRLYGSAAKLNDNVISENTATDYGGGLHLWLSPARLNRNVISGNQASNNGGGLELWSSSAAVIRGSTIVANRSLGNGGGLHLTQQNAATLINNVIADNETANLGSGLHIEGGATPNLSHNTIARNIGGDGSGVYVTGDSTVDLVNTLLAGHNRGIFVASGSEATLEATLWANGQNWRGSGTITRTGDRWGNPGFVDPDGGDYHIGQNSAAIGAGVDAGVTVDIDGEGRPAGLGYDIGADEYYGPALTVVKRADPDWLRPGEQLTYTICVTNTGTVALHATITDTLPAQILGGTASGGTTLLFPGETITWTGVTIPISGVWTYSFAVTVATSHVGPLVNLVQVSSEEGATGVYTQTSTVVAPPGVPTLIAPPNDTVTTTRTINLSWTAGTGGAPDGYNLRLDDMVITTTATTSLTTLSLGEHVWSVRAYNTEGYSDWAAEWALEVLPPPVYLPLVLGGYP
jgi:uncharacterized repeat protein (TIGR01451 family)